MANICERGAPKGFGQKEEALFSNFRPPFYVNPPIWYQQCIPAVGL